MNPMTMPNSQAGSKGLLKSVLAVRGLTYKDLAGSTGLSHGVVRNIACGRDTSRPARAKIETAIGIKIWPDESSISSAVAAHGDAKTQTPDKS